MVPKIVFINSLVNLGNTVITGSLPPLSMAVMNCLEDLEGYVRTLFLLHRFARILRVNAHFDFLNL